MDANETERTEAPLTEGRTSRALSRRDLLGRVAAGSLAAGALGAIGSWPRLAEAEEKPHEPKGRVKQSVCKWCYDKMSVEELAKNAAEIGLKSVELLAPEDWGPLKKYGLMCAMVLSHPIKTGVNNKKNHEFCLSLIKKRIELAAEAGYPSVICFSGNREGIPDDVGIENSVEAIKKVAGLAEEKKILLCMELLNSKVDHKDYQCDRTAWGVEVVKRVGSPNFKLLYDIYHMQIMEGDVIRTIKDNHQYIGHYHTGGNPGRHEIDETQELNYSAIVKAILETGYQGYLGQEFIPVRDPMMSLRQAYRICDV